MKTYTRLIAPARPLSQAPWPHFTPPPQNINPPYPHPDCILPFLGRVIWWRAQRVEQPVPPAGGPGAALGA